MKDILQNRLIHLKGVKGREDKELAAVTTLQRPDEHHAQVPGPPPARPHAPGGRPPGAGAVLRRPLSRPCPRPRSRRPVWASPSRRVPPAHRLARSRDELGLRTARSSLSRRALSGPCSRVSSPGDRGRGVTLGLLAATEGGRGRRRRPPPRCPRRHRLRAGCGGSREEAGRGGPGRAGAGTRAPEGGSWDPSGTGALDTRLLGLRWRSP